MPILLFTLNLRNACCAVDDNSLNGLIPVTEKFPSILRNKSNPVHINTPYVANAIDKCVAKRYGLTRGISYSDRSIPNTCSCVNPDFTIHHPTKPCVPPIVNNNAVRPYNALGILRANANAIIGPANTNPIALPHILCAHSMKYISLNSVIDIPLFNF